MLRAAGSTKLVLPYEAPSYREFLDRGSQFPCPLMYPGWQQAPVSSGNTRIGGTRWDSFRTNPATEYSVLAEYLSRLFQIPSHFDLSSRSHVYLPTYED